MTYDQYVETRKHLRILQRYSIGRQDSITPKLSPKWKAYQDVWWYLHSAENALKDAFNGVVDDFTGAQAEVLVAARYLTKAGDTKMARAVEGIASNIARD